MLGFGSSFTYILLAIVLVVGIYVIIKKFIKKKKQKDNFNTFIKPTLKEKLKKDGYANHSYEIVQRYHHALTSQNKEGKVDLVLELKNPKKGESSKKKVGYRLWMKEIPLGKKEFVWEVEKIEGISVLEIENLLKEKDARRKHRIKYLKKDVVDFKNKNIEKFKRSKKKGFISKVTKPKITNKFKKNKNEVFEKVDDPFDVL